MIPRPGVNVCETHFRALRGTGWLCERCEYEEWKHRFNRRALIVLSVLVVLCALAAVLS